MRRSDYKNRITVALAGTPNVGKSAIFHQMTGMDVIVSNYPGTTVELMEGRVRYRGKDVRVIDLPGIAPRGVRDVSDGRWTNQTRRLGIDGGDMQHE